MANNARHRQKHNLLLISKFLSQRDGTSPFTLLLDSLSQSAKPVSDCIIARAKASGIHVILVAVETLREPRNVDTFVPIWQRGLDHFHTDLSAALESAPSGPRCLVFIDNLNALCSGDTTSSNLPALLSSFLSPRVSLIATYHTDIAVASNTGLDAYRPPPLTLLRYLATTIFTIHSFEHALDQKRARNLGQAEPVFGLDQGLDGVIVGRGAQGLDGLVLEMESRRKSGRGVREWFFMSLSPRGLRGLESAKPNVKELQRAVGLTDVILLEDHPAWRTETQDLEKDPEAEHDVTFSIGLSERQKQDREGVVLPYFDAQKGSGDGGRILYDLGVEDDFDEEEDEI